MIIYILLIIITGCVSYPECYSYDRGNKEKKFERKRQQHVHREQMRLFENTFNRNEK